MKFNEVHWGREREGLQGQVFQSKNQSTSSVTLRCIWFGLSTILSKQLVWFGFSSCLFCFVLFWFDEVKKLEHLCHASVHLVWSNEDGSTSRKFKYFAFKWLATILPELVNSTVSAKKVGNNVTLRWKGCPHCLPPPPLLLFLLDAPLLLLLLDRPLDIRDFVFKLLVTGNHIASWSTVL